MIVDLPCPAPPASAEPNLVLSDGVLYLTWLEPHPDGTTSLRLSRSIVTSEEPAWSDPVEITRAGDLFVNWADFPALAVMDGGRLAAYWLKRSGPQPYAYDVEFATSSDGGRTWSEPVHPHRDGTPTEHGFVSMLPRAGGLDVFWLDGRRTVAGTHGATQLMYARWTEAGFGPEFVLDDRVCDCCQTAAVDTADGPMVVYRDRTVDEVRDISFVRVAENAWTRPLPLHSDRWRIAACPVNGPAAAARGPRVAVAWFTRADDEPRILLSRSEDSGATLSPPLRVDDGGALGRVDVAWLDDHHVVASWLADRGEHAEVMLQVLDAAGPVGPALGVATTGPGRASGFPRLAVAGGRAFLAWTEAKNDATRVRLLRVRLAGA